MDPVGHYGTIASHSTHRLLPLPCSHNPHHTTGNSPTKKLHQSCVPLPLLRWCAASRKPSSCPCLESMPKGKPSDLVRTLSSLHQVSHRCKLILLSPPLNRVSAVKVVPLELEGQLDPTK